MSVPFAWLVLVYAYCPGIITNRLCFSFCKSETFGIKRLSLLLLLSGLRKAPVFFNHRFLAGGQVPRMMVVVLKGVRRRAGGEGQKRHREMGACVRACQLLEGPGGTARGGLRRAESSLSAR